MSTAEAHTQHDGANGHSAGGTHVDLRSYLTGFGLAVVLTAIPFYLVMTKAASPSVLLPTILLVGAVQMLVHIKYFLHLNDPENGTWNMMALLLTVIIVFIVLAGTLWVMLELNHNMMPWMFSGDSHQGMQQSMESMPM